MSTLERLPPIVRICCQPAQSCQLVAFPLHAGTVTVYNVAGGIGAWSFEGCPSAQRH